MPLFIRTLLVAHAFVAVALAQHADGPAAAPVYKNLTQLKDVPAEQIGPAMQFISASLGVECTFCHLRGKMDADDKPAKKTAREMIAMTADINKTHFGGRPQMTCYSCHRGAARPVSVPPVLEADAPVAAVAAASPAAPVVSGVAAPTPAQILEKYVTALGGEAAIRKTDSRAMKGTVIAGGSQTPIEILTKAPNRRVSITHSGASDSFTAFDGTAGWMGNTGRPARVMSSPESGASSLDAEFYLPLRVAELYTQLRRVRPESINGVECEVLAGSNPASANTNRPPVRLYFDKNSGLLLRMVRYAETPLGRNPTQIDYSDYREQDGVKVPFRWTLARPNGRFTIQLAEVKSNAAIDDTRFARPDGDVK
jgi:photosynthetic reaction center cytochrome c subunit